MLFVLTAIGQTLSDMFNGVYADSTVKRVGTYVIFIAILLACKLLSLAEWTRLRWILAGYCLSWLFRSEEHTSELQSLMRISYAVFCLKKKKKLISSITL